MLLVKNMSKGKGCRNFESKIVRKDIPNTNQKKAGKTINIRQNKLYSNVITRDQENDIICQEN